MESVGTMELSLNQLTNDLIELIDTASSSRIYNREPLRNSQAVREIFFLISDERHWKAIHTIKEGAASNHFQHNLGARRMEWLEDFYERHVRAAE